MGIKLFIITLFTLSLFSLFSEITKQDKSVKQEDTPLIIFTNSIMYTLNHDEVTQMVQARNAVRYKMRDELYDSTIVTRVKNENNKDLKDIIYADKIIKEEELYSFFDNVKYDRENIFSLRTNEMYYDVNNEIAYNEVPFTSIYNGDILNGTNLYLDNKANFMKAKKAHFEIDMKKQTKINQGNI